MNKARINCRQLTRLRSQVGTFPEVVLHTNFSGNIPKIKCLSKVRKQKKSTVLSVLPMDTITGKAVE